MPKKIELFDQSSQPNRTREELQDAVNGWLNAHPNIDNVEITLTGEDGKTVVMVYYKTVS